MTTVLLSAFALPQAHAAVPAPPVLTLEGRGVQVYVCGASAGAGPVWVLDHPEAELLNAAGKVEGHHAAGPAWYADDGSSIRGMAVEKTPAPQPGDVPWLVLRVTDHQGAGVMSPVETIRRTRTHGGVAPVQGCDTSMLGATVRVPYTATYSFYGKP